MKVKRVVKDVVLGVAALAGLACILWLLASTLFGLQLIIFTSGSMSPTMPTGTAAIAQPITAEQIEVGDVIKVDRDGRLPVTHRVVSVETDPAVDGGVIVVLKGDANATNDPSPYNVTEAVRIVFPIPGLGTVVEKARTPMYLGGATVVVALLVLWAFWPARKEGSHVAGPHDHEADPPTDSDEPEHGDLADMFSGAKQ